MSAAASPEDPPDGARRVIQRTLFNAPAPDLPEGLYAVTERGAVRREREKVVLAPHTRMTTQTYFGRFPAAYFRRWTNVSSVDAEVSVSGRAHVELRSSGADGRSTVLDARDVDTTTPQTVHLSTALEHCPEDASFWVDIECAEGTATVLSLVWATHHARHPTLADIVVCTFDRPQECLTTLGALAGDAHVLDLVRHVYVVDQGTDTVEAQGDFARVAAMLAGKLVYVRQPNLGGAGGFTRGLLEATRSEFGATSNVLLMDDDIVLEPETVLRLTTFADLTHSDVIVGGQMLSLQQPKRLHAGAERADLRKLASARVAPGAVHDVDLTQVLPHAQPDAGYNGWWCCLLPAEVVSKCGMPLPYFIKWDDIEYGVRAARRTVPTVTLPGAAVWHPDPTARDADDWSRYFSFRNALITSAIHGEFDGRSAVRVLAKDLAVALSGMQYALAATLLKAVEDFLAGPRVLDDGGPAALAAVRDLRRQCPDAVLHTRADVDRRLGTEAATSVKGRTPRFATARLLRNCVLQLVGFTRRSGRVQAGDAVPWHVASFRTVAVADPDPARDVVRVRTYDRPTLLRQSVRAAVLLTRLAWQADVVRQEWAGAVPRLTSAANWERLFGLE